jgi:thiamine kinase-like enzyme
MDYFSKYFKGVENHRTPSPRKRTTTPSPKKRTTTPSPRKRTTTPSTKKRTEKSGLTSSVSMPKSPPHLPLNISRTVHKKTLNGSQNKLNLIFQKTIKFYELIGSNISKRIELVKENDGTYHISLPYLGKDLITINEQINIKTPLVDQTSFINELLHKFSFDKLYENMMHIFTQIGKLIKMNYIHGDARIANILIDKDFVFHLIDFDTLQNVSETIEPNDGIYNIADYISRNIPFRSYILEYFIKKILNSQKMRLDFSNKNDIKEPIFDTIAENAKLYTDYISYLRKFISIYPPERVRNLNPVRDKIFIPDPCDLPIFEDNLKKMKVKSEEYTTILLGLPEKEQIDRIKRMLQYTDLFTVSMYFIYVMEYFKFICQHASFKDEIKCEIDPNKYYKMIDLLFKICTATTNDEMIYWLDIDNTIKEISDIRSGIRSGGRRSNTRNKRNTRKKTYNPSRK